MIKKPLAILLAVATMVSILTLRGTTSAQIDDIYANRMSISEAVELQSQAVTGDNQLINGDFDQLAFYWRPTNHYVAGMWYEWWGNNSTIPEYIDGGIPNHDECYPKPVDGRCHNPDTGVYNSSQGYIRWGAPFVAGIYQPVHNVVPCTLYTFEIWNRNDGDTYGAKVGIDPTGWVITRLGNSGPNNCPPDGASRCPDPYIGDDHGFPSTIAWSAPSYHAAFTWVPISLTMEAAADAISVWTYAAPPEEAVSQSTYWDYGSLVQVPFPEQKLPQPASWTPTGYIGNVLTTFITPTLTIEWTTQTPASTQIIYNVYSKPISPTGQLTHTVYLPAISQPERGPFLDPTPTQEHRVTISGLRSGDEVEFVLLSRRSLGESCATETSGPMSITIGSGTIGALSPGEGPRIYAGISKP